MSKPDLTTYGGKLRDYGYAGDQATMNPMSTRQATNTGTIAIQFGFAVARGTGVDGCKAPTLDADKIIGIAMRQPTRTADPTTGLAAYAQYDVVPVGIDGDLWAQAAEAVTAGDAVISLTASNGALGGTTGGAPGTGRVAVPGATWEMTTSSGQIGRIRING